MRKLVCLAVLMTVAVCPAASAAIVTDVAVNGGFLEVDAIIGSGENTSYVIIDFAGDRNSPTVDSGPRDVYAFGYRYDDSISPPLPTLGDLLDALKTATLIDFTFSDFGAFGGRFVDRYSVGPDSLEPSTDFWASFLLDKSDGSWGFLNTGIDSLAFDGSGQISDAGGLDGLLDDNDVFGFVTQGFPTTALPRVPTVAGSNNSTPEPSTAVLALIAAVLLAWRRSRRSN